MVKRELVGLFVDKAVKTHLGFSTILTNYKYI